MLNMLRRYKEEEEGATAVEFALIAIPFLLIMFGIIEAGRLVWTMNVVQYAVEETGRYASLNPDLTNEYFQVYAEEKLGDMFVAGEKLAISSVEVTSNGVNFVQIEGDYQFDTMMAEFIPLDLGSFSFESSVMKPVIN